MNNACETEWTRKFLSKNFTISFITGELKTHRENLLFEKEIMLLPETQPFVEYYLQAEHKVRDLVIERIEMRKKVGNDDNAIEEYRGQSRQLEGRISRAIESLNYLRSSIDNRRAIRIHTPQQYGAAAATASATAEPRPVRTYTRNCLSDTCHGFLNNQWKCGICETQFCHDCHEVRLPDAEHTCNPDTVATVSLMRQDTKPCPKCHMGIFKIDGCDLMWCTQCHTAFSWRTGEIETNNIHNPHYFEWRRTHGTLERQPGDMLCGREINVYEMNRIFQQKKLTGASLKQSNEFLELCRKLLEYQQYRQRQPQRICTQTLRIQYLLKEITKDTFKTILQREDKKYHKEVEIHNIKEFLYDIAKDLALRFIDEIKKPDWNGTFPIFEELKTITDYSNELLLEVAKTYHIAPHKFDGLHRLGFYLVKIVKKKENDRR
jgi:hypothetical protein